MRIAEGPTVLEVARLEYMGRRAVSCRTTRILHDTKTKKEVNERRKGRTNDKNKEQVRKGKGTKRKEYKSKVGRSSTRDRDERMGREGE